MKFEKKIKGVLLNLALLINTLLIFPLCLTAGTIHLKDGGIEQSERIWESENFVHFILKGTDTVEIRISKLVVEKIEFDDGAPQQGTLQNKKVEPSPSVPSVELHKIPESVQISSPKMNATPLMSGQEKQALLKANHGINFYDPRRKQRYWARHDAQFSHLDKAIESLAEQYNRSTSWIESNMGDENDLAVIHQRIIKHAEEEQNRYKPIQAPDSVKQPSGQKGLNRKTGDQGIPIVKQPTIDLSEKNGSALRFYDPRRKSKYWSSTTEHHRTLKEAIESLAKSYNVSPQWIETHMGETNELGAIHHHIQENLNKN